VEKLYIFNGEKKLRTLVALMTEHKVIEIFFMVDDFCKLFDAVMLKYVLKSNKNRIYHRESTMYKAEAMLIMIPVIAA